ncbi:hypothetical protein AJ79_05029 [Helicocarpus griseus UAMH5409]|uniref:Uncharacterized protein n=1 Tax=Helicocarpus griseus UAMH5409 TaxID=1447875 RepID=A0A2B7XRR9_9EURO|nr:hypothetical protein AJ79_05029 [Helicocarpus griseus UAMH5409]
MTKQIYLVSDTAWVAHNKPRVISTEGVREIAHRFGWKFAELSSKDYEDVKGVAFDFVRERRAREERAHRAERIPQEQ